MAEGRDELSSLERVALALQYKKGDRVPTAPLVCGASRRVLGVTYDRWAQDSEAAAASLIAAQELIGFDGFLCLVDLSVEAADFGQEVIYPANSTPYPNFDNPLIKTAEDYYKIKKVDPRKSPRMSRVIDLVRRLSEAKGKSVAIMGFVYGPLGVLSQMRAHEALFKDLIRRPDAVRHAVSVINESLVEYTKAQVEAGAHGIVLDPLFSSASILHRNTWTKFEGAEAKVLADTARDAGAMVIIHNCGNGVYFEDVIEKTRPVAISHAYPAFGSQTWTDHASKWAKKVVTIGYSDPAKTGHVLTQDEILEDCRQQIETFKVAEGGFILSTGCEFSPGGNLLSAATMVKASKLYGRYN
jgi:uroporphyrinogen decarboxylase